MPAQGAERGSWGWALASLASPSLALLSLRGPHNLHLSACRKWGEGGLERWIGHDRPGRARQASLPLREWVSRAVCSLQAIRHARSMGDSSQVERGGGSCPPMGELSIT